MTALTTARRGFSVSLFLPDGDPAGLKVIEKSNWSGSGLLIPRSLLGRARTRPELARAGVYVLVGESDGGSLPMVYVGEGDPVGPRLDDHGRRKDFWTHAVVFTSKDQHLNKAHVQRLEARLVELAAAAKRCVLDNGNVPQVPSLSESATEETEGFLDDVRLCLPTLGYPFFEGVAARPANAAETLLLKARNVESKGAVTTDGFVVYQGSQASKDPVDSAHPYLIATRDDLVKQGVLKDVGPHYELTQDYTFTSPSTAAGVMIGRNMNGRDAWKTAAGRTLKSIQEAEAGA